MAGLLRKLGLGRSSVVADAAVAPERVDTIRASRSRVHQDVGGSTGGKNDQLLDGVPTGVAARGSYNSPMDAVQEVVVQQNAVDAEYGFSAGGVLNLSMKAGTNEFHGSGYWFGLQPVL